MSDEPMRTWKENDKGVLVPRVIITLQMMCLSYDWCDNCQVMHAFGRFSEECDV
jgi:hypothetical protein